MTSIRSSCDSLGIRGSRIYPSSLVRASGLQDFPANAGVAELLVLLQARNNSVEDMRRLADRLRDASSELERRNQELEKELKARAELEDQLLQSQKMEAIGQLASGVAHDFNNVLLAISGHATLGESATDLVAARRHFDAIQDASDRAADITARLLVFARRRRLEVGELDLAKTVGESRALAGATARRSCESGH